MIVEFYSADPRQPLANRLSQLLKGATGVQMAVAFVSATGADTIRRTVIKELAGQGNASLVVTESGAANESPMRRKAGRTFG